MGPAGERASDVELRGIGKRFGSSVILSDVSLGIRHGEFVVVVGPSGCGKSTLLKIIAGLETQSQGDVLIGGQPIGRTPPKDRDVAMVFQSYALYPHMTVEQNIRLPLLMRRLTWRQRLPGMRLLSRDVRKHYAAIATDVRDLAGSFEIETLLDRKPAQLSGGQRQRVALARAMIRRPRVFLMDEPLSNLDSKLRTTMRAQIKALHARVGATFVYVTHDQAEAMTLADRLAVMIDGRLLQVGSPREIYLDPQHLSVARLIGTPRINCLAGRVRDDGAVDVPGGVLPLRAPVAPGSAVNVAIRSENLAIAPARVPGTLTGTIRNLEDMGADLFVHVEVPGNAELLTLRTASVAGRHLRIGDLASVSPQGRSWAHVLLFDESGSRLALHASAQS